MKKALLLVLGSLVGSLSLNAQNWVNGGNTLSGNGTIGTNSNHSLIFETYNTERGRITNTGLWGIGTGTTITPNAKVHINSTTIQDPLRVQVNTYTKLLVHRSGGLAVGANVTPPANGLYVAGKVGIGIVTPATTTQMEVVNSAAGGIAIRGTGSVGVFGRGTEHGLYGSGTNSSGVYGNSINGNGIWGVTENGYGGTFHSDNNYGIYVSTLQGEYAGFFSGNIYTEGLYLGSDKNIKKDIQEIGNAMGLINQLKPRHYQFRNDGKYASLKLPKGDHYGLLAQDVEEILPNLVKESAHEVREHKPQASKLDENGLLNVTINNQEQKEKISFKAVNYTELIPIVIKGMQEQQQTIQLLQEENNSLKERLTKLEAALGTNNYKGGSMSANLQQNYPNPFKGTTTLIYSIPKGTNGKILVYDSIGKLVRTLVASDAGQVQLDATGLSAGTYVYNLIVNGELAGTKQMVVAQ